jgi:hypothetical protein
MRAMVTIAVVLVAAVALPVAVGWWNRWRFARVEGSFPCKVRALGAPSELWPRLRQDWPRRRAWARWIGESLIARQGLLRTRTVACIALVGPFLAAAVQALPRAPIGRYERKGQGR